MKFIERDTLHISGYVVETDAMQTLMTFLSCTKIFLTVTRNPFCSIYMEAKKDSMD